MEAGWVEKYFLSIEPIRYEMAPALFIAGWYMELNQHGDQDHILPCYEPNEDLTNALYDAMEAYIDGDTQTGDAKMAVT